VVILWREGGKQVTRHRPAKHSKARSRRPRAKRERLLLFLLGAAIFWAIVIYALFVEM